LGGTKIAGNKMISDMFCPSSSTSEKENNRMRSGTTAQTIFLSALRVLEYFSLYLSKKRMHKIEKRAVGATLSKGGFVYIGMVPQNSL
jgi:hypothetical protein